MKSIISDDLNYGIEINVIPRVFSFGDSKFTCTINFYTIVGSLVYQIISNDIELSNFIDSIETYLSESNFNELYFYFQTLDNQLKYKCVEICKVDNCVYLKLYDYINYQLILIASVKMNRSIYDLLDILYKEIDIL